MKRDITVAVLPLMPQTHEIGQELSIFGNCCPIDYRSESAIEEFNSLWLQ